MCEKTNWLRVGLALLDSEVKACRISCRSPSGNGKEVRRRVKRVVGVGMWLLRHDGEVESVVMEDDAVLVLGVRGRARYAQTHVPKRLGHHRVPRLLQCWLLRHEELVGFLGSAVDVFEEGQHRGSLSSTG